MLIADRNSSEICCRASDWLHEGKERHSHRPCLSWTKEELRRNELLGAGV
jgi:hypothetical protein